MAGEQPTPAAPSSSAGSSGQAPDAVPPPAGEVLGVGTVMDTGKPTGPELCLGAIAESYPPQCSGVPLAGWDWATVGKTFESSGDTRWGGYAVQGTYDGTTLTLTQEPVSSALYDPAAPAQDPYLTSCPEPEGGWAVVDDATVGYEDQDAVFAAAVQLPGYAGSFVDQTTLAGSAQSSEGDASQTIVNVLVTEDVAGAERTLREVWGGALCVAQARAHRAGAVGRAGGVARPAGAAEQWHRAGSRHRRRALGRRHPTGGEVVHVLHRHDRRDLLRGLQLLDVDLGQADVADLALLLQRGELADLILERELVVDAVQLEQVDALDAEAAQAQFALLAQVAGKAERQPDVRARCAAGRPWWR